MGTTPETQTDQGSVELLPYHDSIINMVANGSIDNPREILVRMARGLGYCFNIRDEPYNADDLEEADYEFTELQYQEKLIKLLTKWNGLVKKQESMTQEDYDTEKSEQLDRARKGATDSIVRYEKKIENLNRMKKIAVAWTFDSEVGETYNTLQEIKDYLLFGIRETIKEYNTEINTLKSKLENDSFHIKCPLIEWEVDMAKRDVESFEESRLSDIKNVQKINAFIRAFNISTRHLNEYRVFEKVK